MNEAKRGVSSHVGLGMLAGKACADAVFHAVSGAFGEAMLDEQRAVSPLSGGILQHGYQCGVVWGAALAAGARAYRLYGAGPEAEAAAIAGASRIVDSFRAQTGHLDCYDITGIDDESTKMQMVMLRARVREDRRSEVREPLRSRRLGSRRWVYESDRRAGRRWNVSRRFTR